MSTLEAKAAADKPDLELVGVHKDFGGRAVIENVNLRVRRGEFLAVLGPSGSGKSTLLKVVAGFERQSSGVVYLQGADVSNLPPYRRNVNTVFQSYALFPHLSVFENVAYGLRRKKIDKREIGVRVNEALELVDLARFVSREPETLSGGEQQRVAIARALVNKPTVLLLDEPLSALDLKIRRRMQRELKRIHQDVGTTFLYVTHDQEEALVLADRIAVMRGGRFEQIGTGTEIYNEPASHFVADFIGETNWFSGRLEGASGRKHVVVTDGSRFRVADTSAVLHDAQVRFGVRPERIGLAQVGQAQRPTENRAMATITKRIFQGSHLHLEVRTSWGDRAELALPVGSGSPDMESLAPGKVAAISWDVDATMLFPKNDSSRPLKSND